MRNTIDLFICNILGKINNEKENFLFLFPRRPKGRPNICLTCGFVPVRAWRDLCDRSVATAQIMTKKASG
jgi:hypothetical protein